MRADPRLWRERSRKSLAQGETGTNSKRASAYVDGAYPTHIAKAEGCYLWDWQGKKYLDMVGALGANLLGYKHPKVTEAVTKAVQAGGPCFSLPSTLEVEVAEKIQTMFPTAEKVRFLKTGSEAATAAVRIARAASGHKKVYSEGYHGWHDEFTSITPPALGVMPHKFIKPMEIICEAESIAIVEPVGLDASDERRKELTSITDLHDVVIYDEIITGGRVPKYSVARWWGLKPDIICLGKGIANGYPLTVVAGKADIMDSCEYFISSTFSGDSVSLAAANATVDFLQTRDSKDLWFYANRFMAKVNEILGPIDLKVEGYGTRGMFPVGKPNAPYFMQEAMDGGVLIGKAWFFGYAHLEKMHESSILNVLSDAAKKVEAGKVKLRGHPPVETFKR